MKDKRIQLLPTVIAACISLLLLITTTYGAVVVVGGDYTDIGAIVFVSPKPGDSALANGTALRNTLNGITTADIDNPYLIKLGAGTYDLGATGLQMKEYVSIEGSGEKATKITAAVSAAWIPSVATVMGANNTELRSLTVENTGTGDYTAAVLNTSASPSLIHVTAIASGGVSASCGVFNISSSSPTLMHVTVTATGGTNSYGVFNISSSSPTMENVTITASGGSYASYGVYNTGAASPVLTEVTATASGGAYASMGVYNTYSSPTLTNVTATASGGTSNYGVYNYFAPTPTLTNVTATASGVNSYGVYNAGSGSTVKINHSVIRGETNTIFNDSGVTTGVGDTQLDGGAVGGTGTATLTCAVVYDENYNYFAGTCP